MLKHKLKQLDLPQPIAIIGAGLTGKSFFDLLQRAHIDAQVFDERDSVSIHFADNPDCVILGSFHANTFTDFGTVLISPGVDTRRDCLTHVQEKLLTDIELFARLTEKPVIGVTGSNGKSTVVTLIHNVTQAAGRDFVLCGNIGLPVLQALQEHEDECEGYIIELSSYHLERAPSLSCAIGVWLNVSPDHLDRYNSYEDYVATKAKLFVQSAYLVANADDSRVSAYATSYRHKALFSQRRDDTDYYVADGQVFHHESALFALKDFPQIGNHHADNIMAVFAVADSLSIDETITAQACKAFKPLASRAVVVGQRDGVTFINDSKGTNIGATVAALNGIEQPIILLAGGQGKDQDFNELALAAQGRVKMAILFGQDAAVIASALSPAVTCQRVNDLDSAVDAAIHTAKAGDVVMLSPSCASFDQFESYLKRGEHFEQLVMEWIDET